MAPSAILLATLISIAFYNTNSEIINCQGHCRCSAIQSTEPCTLNCATADSCKKSTLTCGAGRPCSVYCTDSSSCADFTHIDGALATDVLVVCDADDACKAHSSVLCGTGDCHLVCGTPTACEEIGIVDVSRSTSFTCNDCPYSASSLQFTAHPTNQPTRTPSANTQTPTTHPTNQPTKTPSTNPSSTPTTTPSQNPSITPTKIPTNNPTQYPTKNPSVTPTKYPTVTPTSHPTLRPTSNPTTRPTAMPSSHPVATPTTSPTTNNPTISPAEHTNDPSVSPITKPPTSANPSANPTNDPTYKPTDNPSSPPTPDPTKNPTRSTTEKPSVYPTHGPITYNPAMETTNYEIIAMETEDINKEYSKISNDKSNGFLIPMVSMSLSVVVLAVIICVCWCRKKRHGMVMIKSDDMDGEQGKELIEIVKEGNTQIGVNDYLVRVQYDGKQLDFTLHGSESGDTNDCGWDENTFEELNNAIKKKFNLNDDNFGLHEIIDNDCFVNIDNINDIAASFVDTSRKTINLLVKCGNDLHARGRKINKKLKLRDSENDSDTSASMSLI